MVAFQDAILKSADGLFLRSGYGVRVLDWKGDEKVRESADKAWKTGTRVVLQNAINDAIDKFSRK